MLHGRSRELGLGPVHAVSLAEARERARQARQCLLDGRDPIEVKREAIAAAKVERLKTMTFRQAALDFLATSRVQDFKNDKHRKQWASTLERYAFPVIGSLPLQQIDTALVLKAVLPVAKRTPATGSRLRGRIERVFDWAKGLDLYSGDNPAALDRLKDNLPAKRKAEHHKAMGYGELPQFMAELRERQSISALALEFTILCATRTSETIGATWDEIDFDSATWVIPAERMKAKRPHRIPLSERAIKILRGLPRNGEHVFGNGKPISNMTMLEMLRGMRPNGFTVHGFRSSFRDWIAEQTSFPNHVAEMALAHVIGDKVEAAYRRGDLFDKRRKLMNAWAAYLAAPAAVGENVVPLKAKARH